MRNPPDEEELKRVRRREKEETKQKKERKKGRFEVSNRRRRRRQQQQQQQQIDVTKENIQEERLSLVRNCLNSTVHRISSSLNTLPQPAVFSIPPYLRMSKRLK